MSLSPLSPGVPVALVSPTWAEVPWEPSVPPTSTGAAGAIRPQAWLVQPGWTWRDAGLGRELGSAELGGPGQEGTRPPLQLLGRALTPSPPELHRKGGRGGHSPVLPLCMVPLAKLSHCCPYKLGGRGGRDRVLSPWVPGWHCHSLGSAPWAGGHPLEVGALPSPAAGAEDGAHPAALREGSAPSPLLRGDPTPTITALHLHGGPPALLQCPSLGRQDHLPLWPEAPLAPLPTASVLPGTSACSPAPRGEGPHPPKGDTRSPRSSRPGPGDPSPRSRTPGSPRRGGAAARYKQLVPAVATALPVPP